MSHKEMYRATINIPRIEEGVNYILKDELKARGIIQGVEHLPRKCKALSSNPSTAKDGLNREFIVIWWGLPCSNLKRVGWFFRRKEQDCIKPHQLIQNGQWQCDVREVYNQQNENLSA
jgi:hypothetical protein